MTDYKIKFISHPETWELRHRVLRPHQTLKECAYAQDDLPSSFHVGAFFGDKIVCVASFYAEKNLDLIAKNPYRLRGMATAPSFHQKGIGKMVLQFAQDELQRRSCDLLWFNAREIAFPFYEKLGFKYLGDLFDMPGIGPHKVMYKTYN